jgi:hypothetical protein
MALNQFVLSRRNVYMTVNTTRYPDCSAIRLLRHSPTPHLSHATTPFLSPSVNSTSIAYNISNYTEHFRPLHFTSLESFSHPFHFSSGSENKKPTKTENQSKKKHARNKRQKRKCRHRWRQSAMKSRSKFCHFPIRKNQSCGWRGRERSDICCVGEMNLD